MRILTRLIISDLLKVLLLALSGMTAITIVVFIAREALDEGVGPAALMRLVPYLLPQAMQYAVPGTVLLATVIVYGRMSGANEIVAIKSMGISPLSILWPVIFLSAGISLVTVWLNDIAMSWGRTGVQQVIVESLEEIAYGKLRSHGSFMASGLSITVRGVEGKELLEPRLVLRETNSRPRICVTASSARLVSNPEQGTITLRLEHAIARFGENETLYWPDVHEESIALSDFSQSGNRPTSPSNFPLAQIPTEIERQKTVIRETSEATAAAIGFHLMSGEFEKLGAAAAENRAHAIRNAEQTLFRLHTEPHRRWASGFCCLAFVLVGAPTAILRRQSEFLASFFAVFLPILLAFYPLLYLALAWAKDGRVPPSAVWTGNIVFAAWGVLLIRRVIRN